MKKKGLSTTIPDNGEMGLFLSAIGEDDQSQSADVTRCLKVQVPCPVVGDVSLGVIKPEHCDLLVRIAAGHGKVDPAPKLPHDGTRDVENWAALYFVEVLKKIR